MQEIKTQKMAVSPNGTCTCHCLCICPGIISNIGVSVAIISGSLVWVSG